MNSITTSLIEEGERVEAKFSREVANRTTGVEGSTQKHENAALHNYQRDHDLDMESSQYRDKTMKNYGYSAKDFETGPTFITPSGIQANLEEVVLLIFSFDIIPSQASNAKSRWECAKDLVMLCTERGWIKEKTW